MKKLNKNTLVGHLDEISEMLSPKPYIVEGFVFELDEVSSEPLNHLQLMQEYGFTDEVAQRQAFDKKHYIEGFEYLGSKYYEFLQEQKL